MGIYFMLLSSTKRLIKNNLVHRVSWISIINAHFSWFKRASQYMCLHIGEFYWRNELYYSKLKQDYMFTASSLKTRLFCASLTFLTIIYPNMVADAIYVSIVLNVTDLIVAPGVWSLYVLSIFFALMLNIPTTPSSQLNAIS